MPKLSAAQGDSSLKDRKPKGASGNGQMANMPQEPVMKMYPKYGAGTDESIDDTIVGIDSQVHDSHKKIMRNRSKSMY